MQTVVISALWIFFGVWRGAGELIVANALVNISCLAILRLKYTIEKPKIDVRLIVSSLKRKIITMFVGGLMVFIAMAIAMPSLRVILGWVTVTLNVTQLVPQAIKSFNTKSTKDLSWWTLLRKSLSLLCSGHYTAFGMGYTRLL